MKENKLFIKLLFIALVVGFTSCTDDDDDIDVLPTDITADNGWVEDEIAVEDVLWFKVSCAQGSTTAIIEWAELDAHGESRNYSGDIMVSAYQLDGLTAYIEDKDNGYGDKAKSFALLNNETEFLVKVVIGGTSTPGTFALRANASSEINIDYSEITVGDTWLEYTIAQDEILGFKVKYSGEKKYSIIWAEFDSPESGYTADITGSVMHSDATTPYVDVVKSKDFLDKNKSHSDDPKQILTDSSENNFKIQIKNVTPGTFALKVVEVID